jgi:hypothetical protein
MGFKEDLQSVIRGNSLTVSATLLNSRVETGGRTAAKVAIATTATTRGGSTTWLHARDEDVDRTTDVEILGCN